ncbi:hypothetical protein ACFLYO_10145 [Chloroflexota bacterium]
MPQTNLKPIEAETSTVITPEVDELCQVLAQALERIRTAEKEYDDE